MALSPEEKSAMLQKALKEVAEEYCLRRITPEYATATFLVFTHILKHWFYVPDSELALLIQLSEKIDMTIAAADGSLN